MDSTRSSGPNRSFATLRQFVRERAPVERCELCSHQLAADHPHLLDPAAREVLCACDACAILFSGPAETRYRRVPRRIRALVDFRLTDAQWDSLMIPIGMAFFCEVSSLGRVVALYPSPAGATESLLDMSAWADLVRDNPVLAELEPDVEALLVNRSRGARQYFLVPIEDCFRLVALMRGSWRGLTGGQEVWAALEGFYAELERRADAVTIQGGRTT